MRQWTEPLIFPAKIRQPNWPAHRPDRKGVKMSVWPRFWIAAIAALPLGAAPNFTTIAGQPTDRSVTINVRADAAVELYFEYGTSSGVYGTQSKSFTATADPNTSGFFLAQIVLTGLRADTQYLYRMQYRTAGSTGSFTPNAELSFHTQRPPGSTFVFCAQGDSHPERVKQMFDPNLYIQTLSAVAAVHPDFYITSGDDFSVDTLATPYTQAAVSGRYTLQLPYLNLLNAPLFLGTGNHEETSLSNYNLPADSANSNQVPIWAQNARNLYYPMPGPNDPVTGSFYGGNATGMAGIGLLRDYYSWQWGDALFVVIDPYWGSPEQVDTGLGGQSNPSVKTQDKWAVTHGDAQYQWLKQTLEQSTAKWKFVFAHHVMGTGRGGVEIANEYEWGGDNPNGSWAFTQYRPTWPDPIHQLMVANHVTIFFQAHDHLYAHQQLDGVVYQSLPNPADNTYTAFNSDAYTSGDIFPNAGYTKVTVSPTSVKVEYIREWLPQDEKPPAQVSGTVQFAYTISSGSTSAPVISSVTNAEGDAPLIAPNTWIAIKGSNLAPTGDSRTWQGSDFVNNQMPSQLDGVSVTINGKSAYVYYISPAQLNVLTPPDAIPGSVPVVVTVNGTPSAAFNAQGQPLSPSLFVFNGGPYIAARHLDGSIVGPTNLYPGLSSPASPGETIALYGNGFGPTSAAVASGSITQSGTLSPLPVITIGGVDASVAFAGLVGPGEFQFNVVLPPSTPNGDQSISVSYNGFTTQPGTLVTVQASAPATAQPSGN
jgi:uncharacterized protein (TIGR03437 family)